MNEQNKSKQTQTLCRPSTLHTNNDDDDIDVLHDEDMESKFPVVISYFIHSVIIHHIYQ